jgi:C_GCAxxG_C_C family probable redox protein
MIVKGKYQGLTRPQLLEKVYQLGVGYETNSYGCSQCAVAALHEVIGFDDVIVKVTTSLCGGTASQAVGTCGALAGGIIVFDYFFGRPAGCLSSEAMIQDNVMALESAQEAPKELVQKYINRYGTINCAGIMTRKFGRPYYLNDPDEFRKIEEAGAHTDPQKCLDVVGQAASWAMEILLDKGAVELGRVGPS